jgi:hypothetical protein
VGCQGEGGSEVRETSYNRWHLSRIREGSWLNNCQREEYRTPERRKEEQRLQVSCHLPIVEGQWGSGQCWLVHNTELKLQSEWNDSGRASIRSLIFTLSKVGRRHLVFFVLFCFVFWSKQRHSNKWFKMRTFQTWEFQSWLFLKRLLMAARRKISLGGTGEV